MVIIVITTIVRRIGLEAARENKRRKENERVCVRDYDCGML